jgi:hypothetical protein
MTGFAAINWGAVSGIVAVAALCTTLVVGCLGWRRRLRSYANAVHVRRPRPAEIELRNGGEEPIFDVSLCVTMDPARIPAPRSWSYAWLRAS